MCLIFAAFQTHPDYPLVVAANRDEFYARPTQALHRWTDNPEIYAGRDLQEGGTWMGLHQQGRFAAVTNYRSGAAATAPRSRGNLVKDLLNTPSQLEFIQSELAETAQEYGGFNTLSYDGKQLIYCSNRHSEHFQILAPGYYGLSNGLLNSDWPKISRGMPIFKEALQNGSLPAPPKLDRIWDLLADKLTAADEELPDTGISLEWEKLLSSRFIRSENYGTRASTIVLWKGDRTAAMIERNFGEEGYVGEESLLIRFHPD
ncbi:hypothetical protein BTA51_18360 [Hahella sp. CCB-MM4]|uniref:NRDE family protein n=1 Tax=Hahella sp. (strain CCB-MM4) TaxID=1926491 RepID=UPI000B9AB61D|nr:NRDE family protein [Hahella sp. CCB-MM4]OZG71968.1 hypothetical protein BTA51_18360 [Hahella sp. CCB-MM4]